MAPMRFFWIVWALIHACGAHGLAQASSVLRNEQVHVRLLAHAPEGVTPGHTFWLGLQIDHAPDWHTYWKNPGDSGLPTRLSWRLPPGLHSGDVVWPLPRRIPIGTLANYGYEGPLLLPVPVRVDPAFVAPASGQLAIGVQAQWLVCRQECIPQEAQLTLSLPVHSASALHGAAFEAARTAAPTELIGEHRVRVADQGQRLRLEVTGLPRAWHGQALALFPETEGVVHNAPEPAQALRQRWEGPRWTADVPVSPERSAAPERMAWVLALGSPDRPQGPAFALQTPVQGPWPPLAPAAGISPALAQALAAPAAAPAPPTGQAWAWAVLGALLGGLLLNLMPCVFPVLAIKLLGLVQSPAKGRQRRGHALAYTGGTLVSFVGLGALMLALRAAGEQLGWGFQLQEPAVVMGLALLFALLGLNLAGLFEWGQWLPSRWASARSRHPLADAAWSGVLAVLIASPCTAPFMGASLGLAITLPTAQALAVFAAMGLGMALPFVLVSLWPGLAQRLPRPGPWMVRFRQAMAFPMGATVVWLVWVLGQQNGLDQAAAFLLALLLLALALWSAQGQGLGRLLGWGLSAGLGLGLLLQWPAPSPGPEAPPHPALASAAAPWGPWQPEAVAQAQAAGRSVLVDFTAAWCVTCQFNKKTVLADAALLQALQDRQVLTLRADWTRRDPRITQELNRLGRSGVPVYAVYRPGQAPWVLSEMPSSADILAALR